VSVEAITIRPERPDQPDTVRLIEALDAHATSLYPPESNHLLDVAALCAPSVTFLVVREGEKAVGCGALLRDPRGWGEVKRMYVRSDRRGRRIGAGLLAALEAVAQEDGMGLLRLETGIHNGEALALYRRAGFVRCAPFGDYQTDALSVFMEKRLDV
jgi:putative acetyltransferase